MVTEMSRALFIYVIVAGLPSKGTTQQFGHSRQSGRIESNPDRTVLFSRQIPSDIRTEYKVSLSPL